MGLTAALHRKPPQSLSVVCESDRFESCRLCSFYLFIFSFFYLINYSYGIYIYACRAQKVRSISAIKTCQCEHHLVRHRLLTHLSYTENKAGMELDFIHITVWIKKRFPFCFLHILECLFCFLPLFKHLQGLAMFDKSPASATSALST